MTNQKFASLVHHIIHECTDQPRELGALRLNQVLWFSDVIAYKLRGRPISGDIYVKRQFGPVPKHILQTLDQLVQEEKVIVIDPEYQFDTRKFVSQVAPLSNSLSDEEKAIVSAVLDDVLGRTANAVSEMSHDVIWAAAKEGEEIPLFSTLVGHVGEVTADVVDWATQSCSRQATIVDRHAFLTPSRG